MQSPPLIDSIVEERLFSDTRIALMSPGLLFPIAWLSAFGGGQNRQAHTHTSTQKALILTRHMISCLCGQLLIVSMKLTGTTQSFAFFSIRVILPIVKLMLNA